jgi:glutamate-1-semialdehyde 2,1-aminomutase
MAAGLETLRILREDEGLYRRLDEGGRRLEEGLRDAAERAGVAVTVNRIGSMLTMFFHPGPQIVDFEGACGSDTARYGRYFRAMLSRGVMLAPSQYEAAFVSAAHSEEHLERAARAAREAMLEE